MKQVFSVFSIACVALFTILLSTTNTGCKKGDDGAKGDTGTANVMYSPWLDVTFEPDTDANGDTVIWYGTIDAPKITKAILDSGSVKVYFNVNTAAEPAVFPLPISDFYSFAFITQLGVYFQVGKIEMYCDLDASSFTTTTGNQKAWQYRYIIIPGGVPTGRSAINWNNYEAVKTYYNIPD